MVVEKQAAIEARRAYQREWRAKNRDKVKKNNENYWMRRAGRLLEERQKGGAAND